MFLGRARIELTPEPPLVNLDSESEEEEVGTHEVSSFDEEEIFSPGE